MTREEAIITKIEKQLETMRMEEPSRIRFNVDELMILRNALKQINEQEWHTGMPTEEGTYLVCIQACEDCLKNYQTAVYDGQKFVLLLVLTGALGNADITKNVVAWQKIEPYEENK